jgi:hypothetical protein
MGEQYEIGTQTMAGGGATKAHLLQKVPKRFDGNKGTKITECAAQSKSIGFGIVSYSSYKDASGAAKSKFDTSVFCVHFYVISRDRKIGKNSANKKFLPSRNTSPFCSLKRQIFGQQNVKEQYQQ